MAGRRGEALQNTSQQTERRNLTATILVIFAAVIAVLLRWSGLASQSLWEDEGFTLWISKFSPQEIWRATSLDKSPPLYYSLLHYWTKAFGDSEVALRSLSALFATLSILLVYLLARKILGDRISVALMVALYAVSFYQIWYAKEARCYALLVLLSLGSIYFLLLCLENLSTLRQIGLVLFLSAGLYTHNMFLFYFPGLAIMWLLYPGERILRTRVKDALVAFSIVFVLYIPWLPVLHSQLQTVNAGFYPATPTARDLLNSVCIFLGFNISTFERAFRDRLHIPLFGFWTLAAAVFTIFVLCILRASCNVRPIERRKVGALLAYSLTPILLVFVYSRFSTSIYVNRVFLGACALLPIQFCCPIAFHTGHKKMFQLIGILMLAGGAVSAFGYLRGERKADWRGATEFVLKIPERRRIAMISPDMGRVLFAHYSKSQVEVGNVGQYDPSNKILLTLLSSAIASKQYKEIDLIMNTQWSPPSAIVPPQEYLAAHCSSVEVDEFNVVEVRRCFLTDEENKSACESTGSARMGLQTRDFDDDPLNNGIGDRIGQRSRKKWPAITSPASWLATLISTSSIQGRRMSPAGKTRF